MVAFEFDFEEIMDEKPYWLLRMLIYLAMIAIGFGLYSHYSRQTKIYIARLDIMDIYGFDWEAQIPLPELILNYISRLNEFRNDPMIRQAIGYVYTSIDEGPVTNAYSILYNGINEMDKPIAIATAEMVKKALEPSVKGFKKGDFDFDLVRKDIEYDLESAHKITQIWILGVIGIFLFLVSLYYGLKV